MNQPQQDSDSWISLGWVAIVGYWVGYAFLEVINLPWVNLLSFTAGAIVLVVALKFGQNWMWRKFLGVVPDEEEGKHPEESLPFFVRGQVRRRKLDLTRKSNFISDSVGTKQKRQTSGITGTRKKKKKKKRR